MTIEDLRQQAHHYRLLANAVGDVQAQSAALALAAEYEAQAWAMELQPHPAPLTAPGALA
jgi:hypothetical protein